MTNGYQIAQEILTHLSVNRKTGHTTAMLKGAENTKCIAIAHDQGGKQHLIQTAGGPDKLKVATLQEILYGQLRGTALPIVFDNAALLVLLSDLVSQIAALQQGTKELENKLSLIRGIASK